MPLYYPDDPIGQVAVPEQWMTTDYIPDPRRAPVNFPPTQYRIAPPQYYAPSILRPPWTPVDPNGRMTAIPVPQSSFRYGGDTAGWNMGIPYDAAVDAGMGPYGGGQPPGSVAPPQPRVYRPGNPPGVTRPSNRGPQVPLYPGVHPGLTRDMYEPQPPPGVYVGDSTGIGEGPVSMRTPGVHPGFTKEMYEPPTPGIHPGFTNEMYGWPQSPQVPKEIGPETPVAPDGVVTSQDIGPAGDIAGLVGALMKGRGRGGGGVSIPMPTPRYTPPSRPEFIYHDPVAAKQAADNLHARLSYEGAQDQGTRDYAARRAETDAATERQSMQTSAARDLQQAQMDNAHREGDANRASYEKIAGMQESQRRKEYARREFSRSVDEYRRAQAVADAQNSDPKYKAPPGVTFHDPLTGKWRPIINAPVDPDAVDAAPAPPVGSPAVPLAPGINLRPMPMPWHPGDSGGSSQEPLPYQWGSSAGTTVMPMTAPAY